MLQRSRWTPSSFAEMGVFPLILVLSEAWCPNENQVLIRLLRVWHGCHPASCCDCRFEMSEHLADWSFSETLFMLARRWHFTIWASSSAPCWLQRAMSMWRSCLHSGDNQGLNKSLRSVNSKFSPCSGFPCAGRSFGPTWLSVVPAGRQNLGRASSCQRHFWSK